MAEDKVICLTNKVYYSTIRKAMVKGARTSDEVMELAGVCNECEGCKSELPGILSSVCGCENVSLQDVIDAIENGADTVEKVSNVTKAGTGEDCGRCKMLIENIIELGR